MRGIVVADKRALAGSSAVADSDAARSRLCSFIRDHPARTLINAFTLPLVRAAYINPQGPSPRAMFDASSPPSVQSRHLSA